MTRYLKKININLCISWPKIICTSLQLSWGAGHQISKLAFHGNQSSPDNKMSAILLYAAYCILPAWYIRPCKYTCHISHRMAINNSRISEKRIRKSYVMKLFIKVPFIELLRMSFFEKLFIYSKKNISKYKNNKNYIGLQPARGSRWITLLRTGLAW